MAIDDPEDCVPPTNVVVEIEEATCKAQASFTVTNSRQLPTSSDLERACKVPACHRLIEATRQLNPNECVIRTYDAKVFGGTASLLYRDWIEPFETMCGVSSSSSSMSSDVESRSNTTDSSGSSENLMDAQLVDANSTNSPTTQSPGKVEHAAASSSTPLIAIFIVCIAAVIILIADWWFSRRRLSGKMRAKGADPHALVETLLTPTSGNSWDFVQAPAGGSKHATMQQLSDQNFSSKTTRLDYRVLQDHRVAADGILTLEFLGKGGHGIVFLVQLQQSTLLASKRLNPSHTTRQQLQRLVDEVKVSSTLKHASIVEFIGVAWTCESDLQVLYEYMPGGDLRSYLQSTAHANGSHSTESGEETLSQWSPLKLQMALQIIEGLAYTHSFDPPLVHRDLKSHNILLCESLRAKISDFGVARFQSDGGTMTTGIGRSRWMAPEVINGGGDYSESSDIYSFGVILTELDTHAVPYEQSRGDGTATLVLELSLMERIGRGELRPDVSVSCPSAIAELARQCLEFDPSSRPNALKIAYRLRQLAKQS